MKKKKKENKKKCTYIKEKNVVKEEKSTVAIQS